MCAYLEQCHAVRTVVSRTKQQCINCHSSCQWPCPSPLGLPRRFSLNRGSTQQSTDLTHVSCASLMSADQRRELLEVVNDINEVVGLEARSVIHSKGLRHRAVYCLVFDSKRRLLLQQRSPRWLVDHECQQLSCDICHSMLGRHSFSKRFLLQKTDWTWSVGSQCS